MATRRLPYGYRFDGTTIIIDDIEGKVVKEIYELFCEGVYITKIKNYIKNFDMSRHKVKRILEDEVYIGINDLPESPNLRKIRSIINAILDIYPHDSKNAKKINKINI